MTTKAKGGGGSKIPLTTWFMNDPLQEKIFWGYILQLGHMQPLSFWVCLPCQQYYWEYKMSWQVHKRKIYLHFTQLRSSVIWQWHALGIWIVLGTYKYRWTLWKNLRIVFIGFSNTYCTIYNCSQLFTNKPVFNSVFMLNIVIRDVKWRHLGSNNFQLMTYVTSISYKIVDVVPR